MTNIDNIAYDDAWCIHYDHYDPADEGRREAVFALGNGYVVTRAAATEAMDDGVHYPGTYRVGCYNRLKSHIEGKEVENESLVNLPNWLLLTFRINQNSWFSLDDVEILQYQQVLDMRQGLLHRQIYFCDPQGQRTILKERRFVSMAHPHLMGLEIELKAENWSGELEINSAIDGRIVNNNVRRYALYNKRHLKTLATHRVGEDGIALHVRTIQSNIEISMAARTRLFKAGHLVQVPRHTDAQQNMIADRFSVSLAAGEHIMIEKIASVYTSKDFAISACGEATIQTLLRVEDFDTLFTAHCKAWERLWHRCKLNIEDLEQLRYYRLHMFQILQNISPHSAELDIGVPPSGWQGEEYMGQIFWDELFIFPFLTFRFPAIARSSLLYRYRRLNEARELAKKYGYQGAAFPWRSASTGREETPEFQLNLLSGRWMKDHTHLEHHISAIIAFNVWHYVQVTGDHGFLADYGVELLLEIARFWAGIAQYNAHLDRYEIKGVVGPDEYHTKYFGADSPGINNNTFTNIMAVWTLHEALQVLEQLPAERRQELWDLLDISAEELEHWDAVSRKMRIIFHEDSILDQFEGYTQLQQFDISQFRSQYGQQRIDWTLEARGDAVERYQVAKQADTALLLYLFSPAEVIALLHRLGYEMNEHQLKHTIEFHVARTVHESTLSRIVYAGALASLDLKASWEFFQQSQRVDLCPEDKDTSEGIHLGAMGGTLSVLQQHYLGLKVKSDVLEFHPNLPEGIKQVHIALFFREIELACEVTHQIVTVTSVQAHAMPVEVQCRDNRKTLDPGASLSFNIA